MAVLYAESAPITSARKNRNIYQAARELKGLTQEVAAERLDLSVESLGAYEQDRRRPRTAQCCGWRSCTIFRISAISISSRVISPECFHR